MNSQLPRRIRVMNKVRDMYGSVSFATTSTHVNITLKWPSDVAVWIMHHGGVKIGDCTVSLTHAEFDKAYEV